MADLTLEILTDREKFPDDRKIVLGDGQEITVKEFRDALIPKGEFTRVTQERAAVERELRSNIQGLQQQLQDALTEAQKAGTAPEPQAPSGGYTREQLLSDPLLGPIMKELQDAKTELQSQQSRMAMHEKYVKTREYKARLNELGSKFNSRFNKDGKGKVWSEAQFLEYVQRNPLLSYDATSQTQDVDLDAIYERYTRDDERAVIEKDAEERGLEKGKRLNVPPPTFGRRRTAITKDKSLPDDFSQVTTDMIAADPEIQEAMQQDQVA